MGLREDRAPVRQDRSRTARRRWTVRVFTVLGAVLLLASLAWGRLGTGEERSLQVFAAASLQDVFLDLGSRFEEAHPGTRLVFNFAGSQVLRVQLAQGAHADLFAPADPVQMEAARREGLVQGPVRFFARNRLVVVVPRHNPAGVHQLLDLARPGLKLVLAHGDVPAGRYSRQVLARAAALPTYGPGFQERVLQQVVSEETNVRQVLAKVRLGEADAGLVYATDVTAGSRDEVLVIEIPEEISVEARYPAALVSRGKNPHDAEAFAAYLLSEEGAAVLRAHGFRPAAGNDG